MFTDDNKTNKQRERITLNYNLEREMYLIEMFLPTGSQVMHIGGKVIFDQVWKMDHHKDKINSLA